MKILFAMRDDGDMTEPMNIMLLSSLAKGAGHQTDLMVIERDDLRDTLKRVRPDSIGQAARIPGVTPADVGVLMVHVERLRRLKKQFSADSVTS